MKTLTQTISLALLSMSLVFSLTACREEPEPAARVAKSSPAPAKCYDCGTVTNIEQMKAKGDASGVGAVAGAVVGAVIGRQIGDGRGQDAATVAGAVGGGFAGNEIEKRVKGTIYYRVTVTMENGGTRAVDVNSLNGLSTGSKVKIVGNNLQLAGIRGSTYA